MSLQWKDDFFGLFLRLQIYEAIAAIFWQSASYVWLIFTSANIADTD